MLPLACGIQSTSLRMRFGKTKARPNPVPMKIDAKRTGVMYGQTPGAPERAA